MHQVVSVRDDLPREEFVGCEKASDLQLESFEIQEDVTRGGFPDAPTAVNDRERKFTDLSGFGSRGLDGAQRYLLSRLAMATVAVRLQSRCVTRTGSHVRRRDDLSSSEVELTDVRCRALWPDIVSPLWR